MTADEEPNRSRGRARGAAPVTSTPRAERALTRDTVAHGEMSGSQELILRFNKAPHGALVEG